MDFDHQLSIYYKNYFPYDLMYRWLSYGQDPKESNYFQRRELSFTLAGDIYVRYQSFKDRTELATGIYNKQPHKIDIGAVFTAPPTENKRLPANKFKPVERELVFDVDLTDYDDVRTCCSGADVCNSCWLLMNAAVRVMDKHLREDFGYEHIAWVFSGRRGIHGWVADDGARHLQNDGRSAVVEYFSTVTGSDTSTAKVNLAYPLHPLHKEAFPILRQYFITLSSDDHQGWLGNDPNKRAKLEAMLPEDISGNWLKGETTEERWELLENAIAKEIEKENGARRSEELELLKYKIVFAFTYPRIDINVSKTQNHLLKSPFCIHPKTEKVCVPLTIEDLDTFFPDKVPTLSSVIAEGQSFDHEALRNEGVPLYRKTSLQPFFDNFEKNFLKPIESRIKHVRNKQKQAANQEREAMMGQF